MQIQKGYVKYKDRSDIICNYAVTDDGRQYYFLGANNERLANGNIIASKELVEAIDPMVQASNIGVIDENGNEVIPFENKTVKSVNNDILLIEKAQPVAQSVIDAIALKNDPLSAAKLVSTSAAIKDKLNAKMGAEGRYVFNDQFSEATVCDINGNNLVNNEYFSFIGMTSGKLYFSKNTPESEITEYSILPPEVQSDITPNNDTNEININDVNVPENVFENALNSDASNVVSTEGIAAVNDSVQTFVGDSTSVAPADNNDSIVVESSVVPNDIQNSLAGSIIENTSLGDDTVSETTGFDIPVTIPTIDEDSPNDTKEEVGLESESLNELASENNDLDKLPVIPDALGEDIVEAGENIFDEETKEAEEVVGENISEEETAEVEETVEESTSEEETTKVEETVEESTSEEETTEVEEAVEESASEEETAKVEETVEESTLEEETAEVEETVEESTSEEETAKVEETVEESTSEEETTEVEEAVEESPSEEETAKVEETVEESTSEEETTKVEEAVEESPSEEATNEAENVVDEKELELNEDLLNAREEPEEISDKILENNVSDLEKEDIEDKSVIASADLDEEEEKDEAVTSALENDSNDTSLDEMISKYDNYDYEDKNEDGKLDFSLDDNLDLELDSDEELFKDSILKADKIINFDDYSDSFDSQDFKQTSVLPGKDTIMVDVAKSMTSLIDQNKEQKNKIIQYQNEIKKIQASRQNIADRASRQEQKIDLLTAKISNMEALLTKLESKNQVLESRVRDQESIIANQSHELEVIRPQLEGKEDLVKLLADAKVLLGQDTYGYGEDTDNYYKRVA